MQHLKSLTLAACLIAAGCATNQEPGASDDRSVARVHSVSKLAAYSGTRLQLLRDPSSRPAMEKVRDGVNDLVAQEKWDTTALVLVAGGHFAELQSDEGTIALTAVPLFIDAFSGAQWDLRESRYAEAAITGIASGMTLALGPGSSGTRSGPVATPPAHGVIEQLQAEARSTR
jgi:hypothetical protein